MLTGNILQYIHEILLGGAVTISHPVDKVYTLDSTARRHLDLGPRNGERPLEEDPVGLLCFMAS